MHELLLFGQVSAARHEQVLNVLAGFCAMQPHRVVQRHVLCKPTKNPHPIEQAVGGGSQHVIQQRKATQNQKPTELYYMHLVKDVSEHDFGHKTDEKANSKNPWVWKFHDTPDAGVKSPVLRQAHDFDVTGSDVQAWVEGMDFK
jgi:mediator of RNA polymerase II transcription subunit 18, fungi type